MRVPASQFSQVIFGVTFLATLIFASQEASSEIHWEEVSGFLQH